MKIKPLKKYSIGYEVLRFFVSIYFRVFYRRLYVTGLENIPAQGPLIFAPNHQNALMDALAIVCTVKRQPVFLARSDIFKKPLQAAALRFLRILPVFRMRDGYGTLKENDEVFDRVTEVLRNGGAIGIMPEGNHGDKKMLRPLKKGILRIAFQAEESSDFSLDLKIVPVGLEFDNYTSFRSSLFVNFGKPFDFKHIFDEYKENQTVAMNKAKDFLADNLRLYMIDIRNEEYHSMFLDLWDLAGKKLENLFKSAKNKLYRHFHGGKVLSEAINKFHNENAAFLESLSLKVNRLKEILHENKLKISCLAKSPECIIGLLLKLIGLFVLSPVWLYGLVNSFIPWLIIRKLTKMIKDAQFISSFKFGLSLVLFTFFYLVQFMVFGIFLGFAPGLLYLLSLPLTGFIAWAYLKWWNKLLKEYTYSSFFKRGKLNDAIQLRDEILKDMEVLVPELKD